MNLDLHIHSTFSDGFLHPQEIVAKAIENNIRVISLTDHDCVTGIGEALRAAEKFADKIKIIPGVELSTKLSDKYTEKASVHILGYFVDYKNQKFIEKLNDIRNVRVKRFVQMKEKLENLGYKVRVQIDEAEKHSLGRPHLANDLVASGYFATVQEAFDELLAKDRPAYVSLDTLTQKEAVDLIHQVGGKAFLAHPVEVKSFNSVEEFEGTVNTCTILSSDIEIFCNIYVVKVACRKFSFNFFKISISHYKLLVAFWNPSMKSSPSSWNPLYKPSDEPSSNPATNLSKSSSLQVTNTLSETSSAVNSSFASLTSPPAA